MHLTHRFLIAGLVALAACADSSPTEAKTHVGTYLLQSAAGQPAPAIIHSLIDEASGQSIVLLLLGDTLEVHADGTYIQHARLELRVDGVFTGRSRWSDHGIYSLHGSDIHFESEYLENIAFDGRLASGAVITLTQNLAGEGTDDEYVLARQP